MANLGREFDADTVPAADPHELIPDGVIVTVVLDKSDLKPTKKADGHYLACEFVVIDGPYEGKRIFDNMNIDNPNQQAVAIAERQLASLCSATGKLRVSDSDELHGIPVKAKIGIEPGKNGYESKNKIKSFTAVNEAPKTQASTGEPVKKAAPWGKKA